MKLKLTEKKLREMVKKILVKEAGYNEKYLSLTQNQAARMLDFLKKYGKVCKALNLGPETDAVTDLVNNLYAELGYQTDDTYDGETT